MPPTQTKRRRVVAATQPVDGREIPHASTQQPIASASNGVATPVRNLPATQPSTPAGAARPLLPSTIADLQQLKDRVTAENAQLKQLSEQKAVEVDQLKENNERTQTEVAELKRRLSLVESPVTTQLDAVETYSNAATIIDFEGERVSGERERTPSIDLSFQSEDANGDTTAVEAGGVAGPVADKIGMFFVSGAEGNYAYSLNEYWQFEHFLTYNPPTVFYFDYEHFKMDMAIEDWERNAECPVLLLRVADIAAWEAKPPLPLTDCVRYKRRMPAGQVGGQPVECQLILFVKNGVNESNEFAVEAFHSEAAFWPLIYALTSVQPAATCGGGARGTKTLLMCRGLDCETLTLYAAEDASRIKLTV
ncbi:hypothetical protein M3Y99_00482500 [Aphelenchoides fujianensis]|nr:hypothetical protein M3Y99_00482500 [Aphelenchoides fujianensis]